MDEKAARLTLKAAFRRLVKFAGGVELAGAEIGANAGNVSKYGGPDYREMPPLMAVARLEAETGEPAVTRVLADMAGYRLVPRGGGGGGDDVFVVRHAQLMKEVADAAAEIADAIGDRTITPAEAARIHTELADVTEAISRLQALLAGGGVVDAFGHAGRAKKGI